MTGTALHGTTAVRPAAVARPVRSTSVAAGRVRWFAWGVLGIAGACLGFAAFLLIVSPLQQTRSQDLLYAQFREQLAAATAPTGVQPISPGAPVAILDIPALGMRQVVVEGTGGRDLVAGPGHVRTTPLPGQVGISTVFGRSTTYGAPFDQITSLRPGGRIEVVTGQGVFRYRVEDVRHDGDPLPPVLDAVGSRLVLVTTEGPLLRAESTVYVDALLVSSPAPSPTTRPATIAPFEYPLASDPSGLFRLSVWLLGTLAVALGTAWGLLRWGRWQTWVVAVPAAVAVSWGVYDSTALLLPNLI